MKKIPIFLSIIIALIAKYSASQIVFPGNIVILAKGDTIRTPKIFKNKSLTNQDEITFSDYQNQKQQLKASQLKAYFCESGSFYSENIQSEDFSRLIRYEVGGYISFGLSYTSDGDMNFYVKKDEEVTALEKHKYNLKSFFQNYLPDYDQFISKYKTTLSYDFKVLAEMISAYNAYKYPDQYVFENYKNIESARLYAFASGGFLSSNVSGYFDDNLIGGSYGVGIDLESRYSRSLSIHLPISYYRASAKGSDATINISSLNFEPFLAIRGIAQQKTSFEFGVGMGVMYSLNSYINCSSVPGADQGNVNISKISVGPALNVISNINKKLKIQLMFISYKANSQNIQVSSPESTDVKIRLNNVKAMILYRF
jgi:hypothetical protein